MVSNTEFHCTVSTVFSRLNKEISQFIFHLEVLIVAGSGVCLVQAEKGKIAELKLERNVKVADRYTWKDGRYHYEQVETQGEMQPVLLNGRITDSFYNAARSAGLSEGQIITIAKAYINIFRALCTIGFKCQ